MSTWPGHRRRRLTELAGVLAGGPEVARARPRRREQEGREVARPSSAPPCPRRTGSCASASTTSSTRSRVARAYQVARDVRARGESSSRPTATLSSPTLTARFDFEGEVGAGHRCGRPLHPGRRRLRFDRRVRRRERRLGARVAARGDAVDSGQELRRHDANRAGNGDSGRGGHLRRSS